MNKTLCAPLSYVGPEQHTARARIDGRNPKGRRIGWPICHNQGAKNRVAKRPARRHRADTVSHQPKVELCQFRLAKRRPLLLAFDFLFEMFGASLRRTLLSVG
jgi:hypothetical protein